jgi:signal transduction histidine kinase
MAQPPPLTDVEIVSRIGAVPTILDVVCRVTGMGFSAVARVTEDRWIACAVRDDIAFGLRPGDELKVETTICDAIRGSGRAVVIDQVSTDPEFCGHPTPAMYGFQSYISMPIVRSDGSFFGTLCAIDPKPAKLNTPETIGMFRMFADLIAFHLDAQERLATSEAALAVQRKTAELRDQFIAVLGHDLRNPLASISAGISLLSRTPRDEKHVRTFELIQNSIWRMAGLIDNVLDFARGRLGEGIVLNRDRNKKLGPVIEQVIAELRVAWPHREINLAMALDEPIDCDQQRIGQLLSNLIANSLTHGATDKPISVAAKGQGAKLEISVANFGKPIPADVTDRLFEPFFRGSSGPQSQGLGLGLYISGEIARAHGGTLTVSSTPAETRFTLKIPA